MYSLELLITAGLAALIIGLVAGFVIAQRSAGSQQSKRQLEARLNELQKQAKDYQHEVTEHFNETAQLLNQLTDSYRDVHTHLAKGAQMLTTDGSARTTLKMLGADDHVNVTDDGLDNLSPPLDYAPKKTPCQPGILNEEYGLEKVRPEDDDTLAANGYK